mgnify:CR=1 FL=1
MPGLLPNIDPDGLLEYSVVYTDRALNHMSRKFQGVMRDISGVLKEAYGARSARRDRRQAGVRIAHEAAPRRDGDVELRHDREPHLPRVGSQPAAARDDRRGVNSSRGG